MKICSVCKIEKPLKEFSKWSTRKTYKSKCKECCTAFNKVWYKANKEKKQDYSLKYNHGISLDQYNMMLQAQNHLCYICGKNDQNIMLSVDHNHKTGKIRSLLCDKCNRGLGYFNDSLELIKKVAEYLEEFD